MVITSFLSMGGLGFKSLYDEDICYGWLSSKKEGLSFPRNSYIFLPGTHGSHKK